MKDIKEIVTSYLKWAPVSLTIREVSRIQSLDLLNTRYGIFNAQKILDVGCGDGRWWTNIIPENLDKIHGIDISTREISLASELIWAKSIDITSDNFHELIENKKFDLIIGNCSMEHIFQIDKALINIHKSLEDDGMFLLFVPTPYWAFKGKSIEFLHKISPRLSMMYSGMINGFFQHWHLYNFRIWISILNNFKFKDVHAFGLGNKKSEFLFRLFLPSAFASFLFKLMSGKYLNYFFEFLIPSSVNDKLRDKIINSLDQNLKEPNADDIFEYILVCKK